MNNELEIISNKIKAAIAIHIGVEVDDIHNDDSLFEDLHMNASDLADLLEKISEKGIDVTKIDLEAVETVEELIDVISSYSEI